MSVAASQTPGAAPKDALTHRSVWSVLGMPVDAVTLDEAEEAVRAAVRERRRLSFVTPNLNWLVRALREPEAMAQVREAELSLADGAPVVWLARRLGAPISERVAGSDLFERLRTKQSGQPPIRVFFFGGRAGAAQKASEALNGEAGGMIACGHLNPGYGDVAAMSAPVVIDTINRARADFLVVSLGAAKGQAWISANQHRLNTPVMAHLGAVVDFVAGTVPRAPAWMARNGLEWLWRIRAEPSLYKRYLSDGLALLRLVPARLWPAQRALSAQVARQAPAQAECTRRDGHVQVALAGDLVAGQLDTVRAVFASASAERTDITLDLREAGALDAGFAGMAVRLGERVRQAGHVLQVTGADDAQARLLRALGVGAAMVTHDTAPVPADRLKTRAAT